MEKFSFSYPLILALALTLAFDKTGWLTLLFVAAMLHECGHLAAIALQHGKIEHITAKLSGMKIDYLPAGQTSYASDAVAALAGPAVNLTAVVVCALIARIYPSAEVFYFSGVNLLLALFNLIPAAPLDGGRALKALLCAWRGQSGEAIAEVVSIVSSALLVFAGTLVLICTKRNASLLFVSLVVAQGLGGKPKLLPRRGSRMMRFFEG